jgi:hypothetical protein
LKRIFLSKNAGLMILLVALLSALSSCADMADSYLVGTEACAPPCYLGIEPGETSADEAVRILDALAADGKGRLSVFESGVIEWQVDAANYFLFPDEGRIERIVLDLRPRSLAVRTTSLRKVIALFGEPAYWSSSSSEDSNIVITVYYPEKGLAFIVNGDGQGSSIEPGARVALAIFLPPSDAASMAASFFSGDAGGSALSNFRIWRGYGAVEP